MGLSDEQFWNLTLTQFTALSDRHDIAIQIADHRAGIIASTLANCHRDPKTQPKPFTAKDFMPDYTGESEKPKEMSPDHIKNHLFAMFGAPPVKEESGG